MGRQKKNSNPPVDAPEAKRPFHVSLVFHYRFCDCEIVRNNLYVAPNILASSEDEAIRLAVINRIEDVIKGHQLVNTAVLDVEKH